MHSAIVEGIRQFNSQKFFEAHETLEALWLTEQGEEKLFLHGLIQVAAAFHHYQRGNEEGFRSLLEKGVKKMTLHAEKNHGIDVKDLLTQIASWPAAARAHEPGATTPRLPVIRTLGGC